MEVTAGHPTQLTKALLVESRVDIAIQRIVGPRQSLYPPLCE